MTHIVEIAVLPVKCIVSSIPTGSPCHCGPTASDCMKLLPDATCGPENSLWEGSCRFLDWR